MRLIREHVERPGQCAGRCLVASKKKDAKLINEFFACERLASLVISRGNHTARNVIKRLGVLEVRVHQRAQVTANTLTSGQHFRGLRDITPGRLENQAQHVDLYRRALKEIEVLKNIDGHTSLKRRRKHGAANDIGGQMAHRQIKGEGLSRGRPLLQGRYVIINRRFHCAKGVANSHVRESRVDHGALTFPALAVGDKNTVTNQMLQRADHQIAFREDAIGIAHDLADGIGVVEQHGRATRVTQIADIKMIGSSGQQLEQVTVALPQHPSQRHDSPQREWFGRNVMIRDCHLSTPTQPDQYGGGM